MIKKKRTVWIIVSGILALALAFTVVQPLPANAALWLKSVLARQPAAPQAEEPDLSGNYTGFVKLDYAVAGLYSDPLAPPDFEGEPPPDLGTIDLGLQITQDNTSISGYVDLQHTLVFTSEHTLDGTDYGPSLTGSFDGSTLTLESERVSLVSAGQHLMRQFRLVGEVALDNKNHYSGEYRETVWGYGLQPLTIVGTFNLDWSAPIPVNRSLYFPIVKK